MSIAAYYTGKGHLEVRNAPIQPPGENDVLIEVAYAGICGSDMHLYHGLMDDRVALPHIPGHEASGTVVEISDNVRNIKLGDHVVVRPNTPCGRCAACKHGFPNLCQNFSLMGIDSPGCFQTYWRVPESTVFKIPAEMPLTHAALIEPVAVANHAVNTIGRIEPNDEVVILGGGPIGLLVALTAHRVGACVTLVEISSQRKKIAESFGFKVLDPKNDDVNSYVREKTGGFGADAVFEVTSSQAGARLMTQIVRPRGRIVIVAMFHQVPEVDLLQFFKQELHMFGTRIYENNDFVEAIETVNKGKLPVQQFITEIHPLMDAPKIFEDLNNRKEVLKILFQP